MTHLPFLRPGPGPRLNCSLAAGCAARFLASRTRARSGDDAHIDHALRFLRPGGALVAIASGSFPTRTDHLTVEVREEIAHRGGTIDALDGEPFAPATSVRCCLVHIPRTT